MPGERAHLLHFLSFFFAEEVLRIFLFSQAFFKAVLGTQPGRLVYTFLPLKSAPEPGTAIQQQYQTKSGYYLQGETHDLHDMVMTLEV